MQGSALAPQPRQARQAQRPPHTRLENTIPSFDDSKGAVGGIFKGKQETKGAPLLWESLLLQLLWKSGP